MNHSEPLSLSSTQMYTPIDDPSSTDFLRYGIDDELMLPTALSHTMASPVAMFPPHEVSSSQYALDQFGFAHGFGYPNRGPVFHMSEIIETPEPTDQYVDDLATPSLSVVPLHGSPAALSAAGGIDFGGQELDMMLTQTAHNPEDERDIDFSEFIDPDAGGDEFDNIVKNTPATTRSSSAQMEY